MPYNVEPHGLSATLLPLYRSPTGGNRVQHTSNHTVHEQDIDSAFMNYPHVEESSGPILAQIPTRDHNGNQRIGPLRIPPFSHPSLMRSPSPPLSPIVESWDPPFENLSVGRPRSVEAGTAPDFQAVPWEEEDMSVSFRRMACREGFDCWPSPPAMSSALVCSDEDDTPRRRPSPLAMSSVPVSSQNRSTTVQSPQGKIAEAKQSPIRRESPIETDLVEALRLLQVRPNFQGIVSTTSDWGQTLAHLSTLYDYPHLLGFLVDWGINLSIADANGLTALHYAYMKGDLDSVRILRRGGASETVMDKLGRTPLDLHPEGFGSSTAIDAEAAVE